MSARLSHLLYRQVAREIHLYYQHNQNHIHSTDLAEVDYSGHIFGTMPETRLTQLNPQ